jgi:D-alanyl-D-alanine carboxypeptidase (penicillin-binding protein 5/6)
MKSIVLSIIIIILILIMSVTVFADEITIAAESFLLIDMDTGEVIISSDSEKKVYPASTTKIMTGILAIEDGNIDDTYTASFDAVFEKGKGGMNIGISPGEEMKSYDLLQAMLISSANEAANIIAENISKTREDFVIKMNNKAKELGFKNTHFTNVIGLHDKEHYTTASDLGKLAMYAMKNKTFSEIVGKNEYTLPPTNYHKTWDPLWVSNKLYLFKSDYYNKVLGIKTGRTDASGYNLVSAAENADGLRLISVIMGVRGDEMSIFRASKALLEYGFKNFAYQVVEKEGEFKATLDVVDANNSETVDLVTGDGLRILLPVDKKDWNIEIKRTLNDEIKAPIIKGSVLGKLDYYRNGKIIKTIDLKAVNDVEKSEKAELREKVNEFFRSKTLRNIIIFGLCGLLFLGLSRLFLKNIVFKRRRRNNFKNYWK